MVHVKEVTGEDSEPPGLGEAAPREPPEQILKGERSWPPAARGLTARLAREPRGQGWGVVPGVLGACGSGWEGVAVTPAGVKQLESDRSNAPLEGGSGWGVRLGCRGDPLRTAARKRWSDFTCIVEQSPWNWCGEEGVRQSCLLGATWHF